MRVRISQEKFQVTVKIKKKKTKELEHLCDSGHFKDVETDAVSKQKWILVSMLSTTLAPISWYQVKF